MTRTKRVKIVTGLKCNIQCVFCYYRDSLNAPNRSFQQIKNDIAYAKNNGIEEIDLSGGEPTVHPDLALLIAEAKSAGMKRVSIISNGFRLADRAYMRTLKEAGLDEILFSVHGPDANVHEQITTVPGSFHRLAEALANAQNEGIAIRTNTVVNGVNLKDLSRIGAFILIFNPIQVNFITINDWCFAKHLVDKLMVRYEEMSSSLKQVCDLLEDRVPAVNVRYIPFCFMTGYERFICNHLQVPYDRFEWVPRVRARLEVQNTFWRYLAILFYGYSIGGAYRRTFSLALPDLLDESVISGLRRRFYVKDGRCRHCRFNLICDGVETTYARKFGLHELCPQPGSVISEPAFFRQSS